MKIFLKAILLLVSLNSFGQVFNPAILANCNDNLNDSNCTYNTLRDFIAEKLNEQDLKQFSFDKGDLFISANLRFNTLGKIKPRTSLIHIPIEGTEDILETILTQIPNAIPQFTKKGKAKTTLLVATFSYKFDGIKLIPNIDYKNNEDDYTIPEKVPIYKGCKPKFNNEKLKKCMSTKIAKFISKRFNTDVATRFNLSEGTTIRIFVIFKIDTEGNIFAIDARTSYKPLQEEAIRVVKMIPKLDAPGYIGSKAVVVPYSLPIAFNVPIPKKKPKRF